MVRRLPVTMSAKMTGSGVVFAHTFTIFSENLAGVSSLFIRSVLPSSIAEVRGENCLRYVLGLLGQPSRERILHRY